MPYTFEFTNKGNYLLVTVSGEVNAYDDVLAYIDALVAQLRRTNITRLLLDEREVSFNIDVLDIVLVTDQFMAVPGITTRGYRVACVCSHDNVEVIRAFETSFQNRSLNYRMFSQIHAAEKWLTD